jgi:carboxymethylenebutenolidase
MSRTPRIILCGILFFQLAACADDDDRALDQTGAQADSPQISPALDRTAAPAQRPDTVSAGARLDLPPDAASAMARLEQSPRHGEWAVIRTETDSVRAWVVYPERSTSASVVVIVHEDFGLTGWVRSVADQLAAEGFIAIAPDLLTMKNLRTDASGDPVDEEATAAISSLEPSNYEPQLSAVALWGMRLPAAEQRYAIVGFGWGGAVAFQHAIVSPIVSAAVVYYGTSPQTANLYAINAPVLGLYGGADARVNATIDPARTELARAGKSYDVHIFEGAGHGFLRQQKGMNGANMRALQQAWPLTVAFLRRHLESQPL